MSLDDAEYQKLSEKVRAMEDAQHLVPMPSSALAEIVAIKQRINTLEEQGAFGVTNGEKDKQHLKNNSVTIAEMVARETKLSAEEKSIFAGFLRKDFFTKEDLDEVNDFYANSWEKLSKKGKDEMSQRLWEGIARGEYKFADLSPEIQEREREHLRQQGLTPEAQEQQAISEKEDTSQTASLSDPASMAIEENSVKKSELSAFEGFGQKPTELAQHGHTATPILG